MWPTDLFDLSRGHWRGPLTYVTFIEVIGVAPPDMKGRQILQQQKPSWMECVDSLKMHIQCSKEKNILLLASAAH